MTISREHGIIVFRCDLRNCGVAQNTNLKDFKAALAVVKSLNWRVKKHEDAWLHFCCGPHEEMHYRGQSLPGERGYSDAPAKPGAG